MPDSHAYGNIIIPNNLHHNNVHRTCHGLHGKVHVVLLYNMKMVCGYQYADMRGTPSNMCIELQMPRCLYNVTWLA